MTHRESEGSWRPTASLERLRLRAKILGVIRGFFAQRGVLEVETPLLGAATVTDLHLRSFPTLYHGDRERRLFLQTSPEFAMKRLLAAGSGPIFQVCKAFRDGESGGRHNPEFTMLEWYRPGFTLDDLMDEVDQLLGRILASEPADRRSYRQAVQELAGFDPHEAQPKELRRRARELGLGAVEGLSEGDLAGWRDLLVSLAVEPHLGRGRPTFVFDYPADQAALARLRQESNGTWVADRFEAYVEGVELANGYRELTDAGEQRERFERDLHERRRLGLEEVPLDDRLVAALKEGLPDCSGVSIGVDRLVMLAAGTDRLSDVMAFPIDRS